MDLQISGAKALVFAGGIAMEEMKRSAMELLTVLGQTLLWVCCLLALEEMTFAGLARLVLTLPSAMRRRRDD